jgi:hypothetical protein
MCQLLVGLRVPLALSAAARLLCPAPIQYHLPGTFFGTPLGDVEEKYGCPTCGVVLDAWYLIVECSRHAQARRQALEECVAGVALAAGTGVPAPPVDRIDLGTDGGRAQFFCLCLGSVWMYDPAPAEWAAGEGRDAVARRGWEAEWQAHRRAQQLPASQCQRQLRRSALTTIILPLFTKFAHSTYENEMKRLGLTGTQQSAASGRTAAGEDDYTDNGDDRRTSLRYEADA